MERKTAVKKSTTKRKTPAATASAVAGAAGVILAVWLIYGTASVDPFAWGLFVEELIIAFCVLLALRFVCVINLPKWISLASVILVPAGIALFGAISDAGDGALLGRALCLAAGGVFALLSAQQLDQKPDGVLLSALLLALCAPVLLAADTRPVDELARALIMAGVFMNVLAVRQKSVLLAYLSSAAFALAGASGLFAAFAGAGAGVGALLLAPKRKRPDWALAAALMAALPIAVWFAANALLMQDTPLFLQNAWTKSEFAALIQTHLLRTLALGLLLLAIRFFFSRENAAVPVVLALAACALARLVPLIQAPNAWMDALPLCVLAGVGTAKTARNAGR